MFFKIPAKYTIKKLVIAIGLSENTDFTAKTLSEIKKIII